MVVLEKLTELNFDFCCTRREERMHWFVVEALELNSQVICDAPVLVVDVMSDELRRSTGVRGTSK